MSVQKKKWNLKNDDASLPLSKKLFLNRGLETEAEIQEFIDIAEGNGLHDPYLMKDMDKAVPRLIEAIEKQEKIIVFGDYDVDGVTGAAILLRTLHRLGAVVSYRIPHRVQDGYGLNMKFIDEFIRIGVDLVITVDCGISCKDEVTKATEAGIDVIITDHHTVPSEPPTDAVAIVHPLQEDCDYPFKGLTGAAVGFKVCQALAEKCLSPEEREDLVMSLMDLASMGTVADCGPLLGENRYIVKRGLEVLKNTRWEGLRKLMKNAGVDGEGPLDTTAIGFRLAPRINAVGRISTPLYALQLLLQEEGSEKADQLAQKLEEVNRERQQMLERAFNDAHERVKEEEEMVIMAWDESWHVGILGLIAGRLAQQYGKPAIIRSNEHFNLVEALTAHAEFLQHFGGHHEAAGFDLKKEDLEGFVSGMKKYAAEKLAEVDLRPTLELECELQHRDVTWETIALLESLGPYGTANEEPCFLLPDVEVVKVKRVGADMKHLSLTVKLGDDQIRGIAFKMGEYEEYLREHARVDLACHLKKNVWKGNESIQLQVVDLR